MRKWRPGYKSLLVIPKVHGAYQSLSIILERVLPLRFSVGQEDALVLLGDYIDKGEESDKVLDLLISIQDERILMLRGNQEELLLKAFSSEANFEYWLKQGGVATLIAYLKRAGLSETSPYSIPYTRLRDLVPESHLAFLRSLPCKLDFEGYYFTHAGFNYLSSFEESSDLAHLFDDSAIKYIKNCYAKKIEPEIRADKPVIAAHNPKGNSPFVSPRYMGLDAGAPARLIIFDLASMKCGMVKQGKSRIYDHKFQWHE